MKKELGFLGPTKPGPKKRTGGGGGNRGGPPNKKSRGGQQYGGKRGGYGGRGMGQGYRGGMGQGSENHFGFLLLKRFLTFE